MKRILLPAALFVGVAVGLAAGLIYEPRLAELFVGEMPQMIVPMAVGTVIIWRQWVLEKHVDGRIDELKPLLVDRGRLEGMREATVLAREDRKEFKEALLTPPPMQPMPPEPPKKK